MDNKAKKIRIARLTDIKVLTDNAKNLILDIEKKHINKIVSLNEIDSKIILNGYMGIPKPENYKNSFLYAIARVFSILGYAKTPVGKNKVLIEDIKRVKMDDNDILTFDFMDKLNFIK